jgi:acyl-CoA synthetase (AMP-forming)/AMP-acid ligase II
VGALPGGETPAAILYTSGSTGRPKGILLSHANLLAGARIVSSYLEIAPDERILSVLPFSFDYGLNQLLCAVQNGATLVLARSNLPADICRTMQAKRITALAGVPPLFIQLMDRHSPLAKTALPDLRYLTNSGGVFPVELVRRYRAQLPHVRLYLMYGLSEAFRSTYLPPSEVDRIPSSMGRAIPETEILVIDEHGEECDVDVVGELVHRGPTVALGYWNDAAATARVFRPDPTDPSSPERVVYSGDLVKKDADGFLYFCGRRDQLIKSFGYRISPDEVEELLLASGLVREVAVRGEADPVAGARVEAHVVPADAATFDPEALLAHCRRTMPRYMVPRALHVRDSLPRTASGKLDRTALGRREDGS